MRKVFTLAVASLFTMAVFATDRRPSVTVQASKNYEIMIDGKSYYSNFYEAINIDNLYEGNHTVTVYDAGKGFFRRFRREVASSSFMLRSNDISIFIDQYGRININESRMGRD